MANVLLNLAMKPVGESVLVKVDLTTFTIDSVLVLSFSELVSDMAVYGDYAYITYNYGGSYGLAKVHIPTLTEVDGMGVDVPLSAVLGVVAHDGILYCGDNKAKITKIDLPTFTQGVTADMVEGDHYAFAISGNYLYTASRDDISHKIDLSTFTLAKTLDLCGDYTALIHEGWIYYGRYSEAVGQLFRVNLAYWDTVADWDWGAGAPPAYMFDYIEFEAGETRLKSLAASGNYIYAGLQTAGAGIVRVSIDPFERVDALYPAGKSYLRSLITHGNYLYAAVESACFAMETLIHTPNGMTTIKEIKVGDLVYSMKLETREIEPRQVLSVRDGQSTEIARVVTLDGVVECTPLHPFRTSDGCWVKAKDLRVGDRLVTADGQAEIIGLDITKKQVKVRDLKVPGHSNYFVGSELLLVHNKSAIIAKVDLNTFTEEDGLEMTGFPDHESYSSFFLGLREEAIGGRGSGGLAGVLELLT